MKLFARDSELDLSFPHVMGILNVTPDSFFDGGRHNTVVDALRHTNIMVNAGASIIDVGGESTRPGALKVSVDEELNRVIPVIEAIVQRFEVWVSVDTSKAVVMKEAAKVGAHIINDICSLSEPGSLETAAATCLPVCLMHMQGEPLTMQDAPRYGNIVHEVDTYFTKQILRCKAGGIKKENMLLDPGFGFGKNLNHNYQLLAHLSHYHHFGLPLLVGISRKSMISNLLNISSSQCLTGSLVCAVIAAMQGAQIIRVHDVKETVQAMSIIEKIHMERQRTIS